MLVIDFRGLSKQHKLVSSVDVLAGDLPPELVEEVKAEIEQSGERVDARKAAWEKKRQKDEEAAERRRQAEEKRRKQAEAEAAYRERIKAAVRYTTEAIDAFDRAAVGPTRTQDVFHGGCSDKQVNLLVRLGMAREAAMKLSARQASGAIGNRLGRTGKDYIVRESGPCMGKSLADLARENMPALQRLARTTTDGELLNNLAQYREQWRKGER